MRESVIYQDIFQKGAKKGRQEGEHQEAVKFLNRLLNQCLLYDYFTVLGVGEHFFKYRYEVRDRLLSQLAALKAAPEPQPVVVPINLIAT